MYKFEYLNLYNVFRTEVKLKHEEKREILKSLLSENSVKNKYLADLMQELRESTIQTYELKSINQVKS